MRSDNPIFQSLSLIEERIQEKLTVENLADSLHISKYHYQRIFREAVGDSVMRYITRRRISMAAAELAENRSATVLEIALRYGYDTHEGFTRSFRAYMGVTPTEYRKYHQAIVFPITQKEGYVMLYSKTTDEILRELNSWIVQVKETAEYTRKNKAAACGSGAVYAQYWENTADRADAMADRLTATLGQIAAVAQQPDGISARYRILKVIEDVAFWSNAIAFETGLTIARARPEHRAVFAPVCEKYNRLAQNARLKTEKLADFFSELSVLVFQDMKDNATRLIQQTVGKGRAAAGLLAADTSLPYGYIAEEIMAVAEELGAMPLDRITVWFLEDCLLRLDIVSYAADVDAWRMPSHKAFFEGIFGMRECLRETKAYFESLSGDLTQTFMRQDQSCGHVGRSACKKYNDIGVQGNVLLFYLKGELQKLGSGRLDSDQQAAFEDICGRLGRTFHTAAHAPEETDMAAVGRNLQNLYEDLTMQAETLGAYAGPIRYIAEQIGQLAACVQSV